MNPLKKKSSSTRLLKRAPTAKTVRVVKPSVRSGRCRRKSIRRVVPLSRQSCKLVVGDRVLPASLVNKSRGGFAIWIDNIEGLKTGEKVRLHAGQRWFTTRVVYVREIAASPDSHSKGDSWFQLGLKKTSCLSNLLDPEAPPSEGTVMVAEADTAKKHSLRTKGKIESAIAEEVSNFEQEYLGYKPRKIFAYLMGDLLVVRFQGVFAEAKQQLAELLSTEKRQEFLKDLKEVQGHLVKITLHIVEAMVEKITGVEVLAAQHEIDATTGEKVFFFTLAHAPECLE